MIKDENNNVIDLKNELIKKKGIYKFYVKRNDLETMLNNLNLNNLKIDEEIEKCEFDNDFYCVYVGQATSDNKKNPGFYGRVYKNHIKGRGGSTLRTSLKVALNYKSYDDIDIFFNNENNYLFILKEVSTISKIDLEELEEINNDKFKILNIIDNKHYLKNKDNIKALLRLKSLRK